MDLLTRDRLLRLDGVELREAPPVEEPDEPEDSLLELLGVEKDESEDDESEDEPDAALVRHRMLQLLGVEVRDQLRNPKGSVGGGRFRSKTAPIIALLKDWANGEGPDNPLDDLDRDALKRAAVDQGITVRPRAPKAEIIRQLLYKAKEDHKAGDKTPAKPDAPKPDAPEIDRVFTADQRKQAEKILSRLSQGEFEQGIANPKRTRKELSDTARLLGLPTSGTKEVLQKRLAERAEQLRKGDVPESPAVAKVQAAKKATPSKATPRKPATPDPEGRGPEGLSSDPAVREVQVENRIRAAYAKLLAGRSDSGVRWVGLAELRDELGESVNRHEVDAALIRLLDDRRNRLIPEENQKTIKQADQDSAVVVSGEPKHLISMHDPSLSPLPTPTRKATPRVPKESPTTVGGVLIDPEAPDFERLTALSQARTVRDMKALAAADGVRVPSYLKTSTQIRDYLAREFAYNPGEDFDAYAARFPGASGESPADVAAKLESATSREEAHNVLKGKTRAELVEIAKAAGVSHSAKASKASIEADLVQHTVGSRLLADAISGGETARLRAAKAAAKKATSTVPEGINFDDPSIGADSLTQDTIYLLQGDNFTPEDAVEGFIEDGIAPDMARQYVAEILELMKRRGLKLGTAKRSVDLNEDDLLRSDLDDEEELDGEEPDDGEELDEEEPEDEVDDAPRSVLDPSARERMFALARVGETRMFNEADHPRGKGAKGGEFVKKDEGDSGTKSRGKKPGTKQKTKQKPPAKKTEDDSKYITKPGKRRGPMKVGGDNDPAQVKELQALLKSLGLSTQNVSGTYDKATENAVKEAQRKLGLNPTGRASAALVKKMLAAHALSPCAKGGKRDAGHEFFELRRALIAGDLEERDLIDFIDEVRAADDNQLKHYWTRGEGLAKWRTHPHPWTALRNHLRKYVGPGRAERMASDWFHEVFGYWPGHRKGANPVGPG